MRYEKSAGAIVFYLDKKQEPYFLMLKNTLKTTFQPFPKGKVEQNQTERKAAKRETKEETNLDIKILENFKFEQRWYYTLEGETINKKAVFYLGKIKTTDKKNVKISREHEDFKWLRYEKALKRTRIKQNKEMIKQAYRFINEWKKQKRLF